ncbi:MAG TPA: hypothetical protein VGP41_03755 [Candidatus Lustribacter sp.]|jgi:hypothetical protein|nr:hypothetical protein [Candidatus Lustribacter sp.]
MQRTLAWIATFAICVLATMPARAAQLAFVSVAGSAAKADPPVAIEPIAQKLGWTFKRTADGAILDDGTGAQTLRVGSRFVREDGTDVQLFDQPASDRNGHIELAISDAATLFHLSVQRDGPGFVLVTPPEDDVDIREIPRPPAPSPAPVHTPQPEAFSTPPVVAGNAGTLAVSVEFDGNNRVYQTNLSGDAGLVRGSVSSYGSSAVTNPVGSVTVGAPAHSIGFGSIDNPLAGSVITNGSLTGITAHLATGKVAYDLSSGDSIAGNISALERTSGNASDSLAWVSGYGATAQPVFRHGVTDTASWGTLDYETLIGLHGVGAGLHARTKGKTFIDAIASATSGSLPLLAGDVPTGAVIGEHLSNVTTVTAGYVHALDSPGSPTVGVTTRWNNLNLGANVSKYWTNLTASYAGRSAYGSFYASAGAQKIFGVNAGVAIHKALAEVDVNSGSGTATGIAQLRTNHPGINLAAGIDFTNGKIGPLVGVVVPVAKALAFELGVVQGPSGNPALRFSILAGFHAPKPRVATFPVTVFVPDAQHFGRLRVFVDGVPSATPYADDMHVMVPAGKHSVFVESADQSYGSSTVDVVAGTAPATAKVELPLFPQRSITGTVRFGGAADSVPAGLSLEGIRVVLEPSGEAATTDADGHFVFARGPYDPASTLLLDPSSVPGGFQSPAAMPIGATTTDIILAPLRKVEHTTFH